MRRNARKAYKKFSVLRGRRTSPAAVGAPVAAGPAGYLARPGGPGRKDVSHRLERILKFGEVRDPALLRSVARRLSPTCSRPQSSPCPENRRFVCNVRRVERSVGRTAIKTRCPEVLVANHQEGGERGARLHDDIPWVVVPARTQEALAHVVRGQHIDPAPDRRRGGDLRTGDAMARSPRE